MNWNTPLLEFDNLREQVAALTKERDDLKVSVEYWASHAPTDAYVDQLAASQAREARLREALTEVRKDLVQRAEMDQEDGGAILNIGNGVLRRMDEALALPTDDTALQQRLAQERERCADVAEDTAAGRDAEAIAEVIRGLT